MDDAEAAVLRHGDGQPDSVTVSIAALSERHVQADVAGEPRRDVDLRRQHRRVLRHQQDVVERQGRGDARCRWARGQRAGFSSIDPLADRVKGDIVGLRRFTRRLRGTSCISCRCRTGTDRSGPPSAPRAAPS